MTGTEFLNEFEEREGKKRIKIEKCRLGRGEWTKHIGYTYSDNPWNVKLVAD